MPSNRRNGRLKGKGAIARRGTQQTVLTQIAANTQSSRAYEPPNTPDIIWRLPRPKTVTLCLTYEYGTQINYVAAVTVYSSYGISFTLNSVPNYANYTASWDQYRIVLCRLKFTWFGVIGSNPLPPCNSVIDYDDATAPTSEAQVINRPSSMAVPPGVTFERVLQPHTAVAMYGGAFTSFGNRTMQWCDSAYPGVIGYGLKLYLPAAVTAQVGWNLQISMQVQFRNQL